MEQNQNDLKKEKDSLENTSNDNEMKEGKYDGPDFNGVGVNEGWEKYLNPDEFKKSMAYMMSDIVEYKPHSLVAKSIIKRSTGDISVMSFDTGAKFNEKISRFDSFFLIIEGKAEVTMGGKSQTIKSGQGIIIPAEQAKSIEAKEKFKMITAVIKGGYE